MPTPCLTKEDEYGSSGKMVQSKKSLTFILQATMILGESLIFRISATGVL